MIAKQYRFQGQNGLRYVYRRGQSLRTKYARLQFTNNPHRTSYRAAVVVSKKVAKSAPLRNRIRRRIYEAIREYAPQHLSHQDIVLTVYDPSLGICDYSDIRQLVRRFLVDVASNTKAR